MMNWGSVSKNECGSIAPLAVVVCLVLVAALGFAIDHGVAYAVKNRQEQAIDAARAQCMDPSGAVLAKYAENPGLSLADDIAQSVRAQGVTAPLDVWFYEAPAQAVPRSERLWIVGVQVSQSVQLPFSGGVGLDAVTVASSRVMVAKPYAAEVVWRPERRLCGRYRFAEGSSAGAASFLSIASIDGFPSEMVESARSGSLE